MTTLMQCPYEGCGGQMLRELALFTRGYDYHCSLCGRGPQARKPSADDLRGALVGDHAEFRKNVHRADIERPKHEAYGWEHVFLGDKRVALRISVMSTRRMSHYVQAVDAWPLDWATTNLAYQALVGRWFRADTGKRLYDLGLALTRWERENQESIEKANRNVEKPSYASKKEMRT